MAKAKTKQIYMSEPLEMLAEELEGSDTSFSGRLSEIVRRYGILLDLEEIPDFSEDETMILGEAICGAGVNRRFVRGLHLDVLDVSIGTEEKRETLSRKVAEMGAGQRLALIERLGQ